MQMDLIFKIAAIGLCTAVINTVLAKSGRDDQALLATIAALIAVLLMIIDRYGELIDALKNTFDF